LNEPNDMKKDLYILINEFEQESKTFWLPVKCIIWRKILECFHQKTSFLFDWRKKDMDDMGV